MVFSELFFQFSKFRFNFEHFKKKKKNDPQGWCMFEVTDYEKQGEINV